MYHFFVPQSFREGKKIKIKIKAKKKKIDKREEPQAAPQIYLPNIIILH